MASRERADQHPIGQNPAAREGPRVLLVAEAANPEWVSVPLVGWSQYAAMARLTRTHLVTQVRNREAIERTGLVEGRDFTAIDNESVARPLYRLSERLRGGSGKGWTMVTALQSLSYYAFERRLWKLFAGRLAAGEFDLVHRVTPLSPTAPSLIAGRCARAGVPFVLGPLNGGLPWPAGFDGERRREREWLSYVRGAYKLLPGQRATRRHAAAILVASRATYEQLPAGDHERCVYIPENGIDPSRFGLDEGAPARAADTTAGARGVQAGVVAGGGPAGERVATAGTGPVRVAFLGRLVPYKGCDMLLEAAAPLIRSGAVTIDVIGDGPERGELEAFIAREQLGHGVRLRGWVEHADLAQHLSACEVLGFPSVREFGGGVALEAMALGLVPIVVDYGGPAELVSDATGHRVPLGTRAEIVAGVRTVLERMVTQREALAVMGAQARARVARLFTWDAKARQTLAVYEWVLGRRAHKPDFGMPFPDQPRGGTALADG